MNTVVVGVLAVALWQGQPGAVAPAPLGPSVVEQEAGVVPSAPVTPPVKYAGVSPGGSGRNPLPTPKREPTHLVWTGFRMAGDRAEVFFQTSRPVEYELKPGAHEGRGTAKGRGLSVFLRNCRIHYRNNSRSLDTRFFRTPVAGVSARQRRHDVELSIALKEDARPEPRTEVGPDGTHFLVLQFPAASVAPGPVRDGDPGSPDGDRSAGAARPATAHR
jgi:hypothetical protein